MALSYAFGGNTGQSYEELQRRRLFAEAMMQRGMSSQPKTAIEGINNAASSIMGALLQKKLGAQDAANREKANQTALDLFSRPAPDVIPPNPGISTPRNPNDPVQIGNDTMAALGKTPSGWDGIKAGIFAGESGGDYNALFGFQNRPGGAFSNVQLTGMSVDDALKFADPNGQYGQHVKGQIGRVATPMGAYQVVGTTLAAAKKGLGLRGDEIMTPALQDRIGQWIYQNQGTGAWEGYKGPQQPQGGMDPQILMAMGDPNVSPEIKSALGMLLQQRIAAAQPPDPVNLQTFTGPDGATYSFNPVTGEAKPVTASKPLDPGYRLLSADESKRMGLPEGSYQVGPDNKISKVGGEGTNVTINNGGNSSKFSEESDKAAAARFDGYIQSGTAANQMMGDLRALADLAPQIGTGKTAEVMATLGPYAQALGIDVANLDESQAFKSIVDRLAPQMRPVGAGSSSDFDARQFLNSLPKLGNTPEGNQIILQTLEAVQKQKLAAAEIAQLAYISPDQGGVTWQEAEKRIRALGNPYDAFNEYSKSKPKQPSPSSDPAPSPPSDDEYLKSLGLR